MPDRPSSHVTQGPLLCFEPDSFLLFQNKALGGGKRKQWQGPVWLIPGSDMWGSSCGKEGFLLETNWNNLVRWTWIALKFFCCLLTSSCAMLCPLPVSAHTDFCCCSATPEEPLGPYCIFSHKNTFISFTSKDWNYWETHDTWKQGFQGTATQWYLMNCEKITHNA